MQKSVVRPITIHINNVHVDMTENLLRDIFYNFGEIYKIQFSPPQNEYRQVNVFFNKIMFKKTFYGSIVEDIVMMMKMGMQFPISYKGIRKFDLMCIEIKKI